MRGGGYPEFEVQGGGVDGAPLQTHYSPTFHLLSAALSCIAGQF
jgi:hypothetical protein